MYFLGGARGQDTQMGVAYSEDLLHWTKRLIIRFCPAAQARLIRRLLNQALRRF